MTKSQSIDLSSEAPTTLVIPSVTEQRKTPIHRNIDVLVAGGGPAGFAAALSAARAGARTLLVERYGYLGGMITGSKIIAVLGVGDGVQPKARGVVEDLRKDLEKVGGISQSKPCGDYWVDAEIFKWRAAEMLLSARADVLLHTLACDPVMDNGRVRGIFTESKNGRSAIGAKVVVDCTADADIAARAGAAFENRTHRVTLVVFIGGIDRDRQAAFEKKDPERHQAILEQAKKLNGGSLPAGRSLTGVDVTDAAALTKAEIVTRRDCFAALNYLRANMPGWEKATVTETCPQIGVRVSRRIEGLYKLTVRDMQSNQHHEDTIARLGAGYDIPYRCLVPRGIKGLLVAGRCISFEYEAADTLRLIAPCLAIGQAAGIAAALAVKNGIPPDSIPVDMLRAALLAQGVNLGANDSDGGTSATGKAASTKQNDGASD